jgi:hypothetical protein
MRHSNRNINILPRVLISRAPPQVINIHNLRRPEREIFNFVLDVGLWGVPSIAHSCATEVDYERVGFGGYDDVGGLEIDVGEIGDLDICEAQCNL